MKIGIILSLLFWSMASFGEEPHLNIPSIKDIKFFELPLTLRYEGSKLATQKKDIKAKEQELAILKRKHVNDHFNYEKEKELKRERDLWKVNVIKFNKKIEMHNSLKSTSNAMMGSDGNLKTKPAHTATKKTNITTTTTTTTTTTNSENNFLPETCEWANEIPRSVTSTPECGEKKKVCVGYVICDQKAGDGKFIRMSTCSASNCNDAGAVACTKEIGYGSRKPSTDARFEFGATEQSIILEDNDGSL